jgi:ABC-2 type transport system ATP-binding protein
MKRTPEGCPDSDAVIDARDLRRSFGSIIAVDGLTLRVRRGEIFGVLGHNGAGKTTFLRLVNGLLRPSGGEVFTLGLPSYGAGSDIRARSGVVTESTALDDFLTIRESLVSYGTMAGMTFDRIGGRVAELIELFGLGSVADLEVRQLSAGMRQRAAFARGLVHEPELLLLDEPTANMDPVAARQVRNIVTGLARRTGCTVVLSTHNLAEAEDICDRIAVLRSGRLQAMGTISELGQLVGRGTRTVKVRTTPEQVTRALNVAADFGQPGPDGRPDTIIVEQAALDAVPGLVAALVRAGVPVQAIIQDDPTLEDVYLALHRGRVQA